MLTEKTNMLALKNGGLAFLGVFGHVAFLSRKASTQWLFSQQFASFLR